MDGQARIGIYDVGADESSLATIVRKPLTAGDVGPDWLYVAPPPPGGGGCDSTGCAIQAEAFSAILDPDSDGNVWTTQSVASALGELVIKAPAGSTVSNPAQQETIAAYDMTFATAGTYTAYYRVRGFNGSSDSFYAPDGFGVDPDNSITTNQDGTFFWKKDTRTFAISAVNTGVPLEFRLGMRESNAEIDALVLNLNANLSAAQLDDLFAVLLGDYNHDGLVDAADFTMWRDSLNTSVTKWSGADGNGDGFIDENDYVVWREHFGATSGGGAGSIVAVAPEPLPMSLVGTAALLMSVCRSAIVMRNRRICHA